jgi:salicylate hydroxylase
MNDFSGHLAIIGAGISGLALGCTMAKEGHSSIIFEKNKKLDSHGAGISISPNAIKVFEGLEMKNHLNNSSELTLKSEIFSYDERVYSASSQVRTTSRESLYKILLEEYISLGGSIYFEHELENIDTHKRNIFFKNGNSYKVRHIAACDGIKSTCRKVFFESNIEPVYSGYSAWRGFVKNTQDSVRINLAKNSHVVRYPINKKITSFVGVVKTNKKYKEQWKAEGDLKDMQNDLSMHPSRLISDLSQADNLYKWGIYTRPQIKTLIKDGITLLGDAAHPIVPFLGQGGCMALEDAYIFGKLFAKNINNIELAQSKYEQIRLPRLKFIKQISENQGRLYHLSNPLLIKGRNLLMKLSNKYTDKRIQRIWDYDPDKAI